MKKILVYVSICLALCCLLHRQILGAAIKLALKFQYDCELAYRDLDWKEGNLVLTDLVVFDPSFHSHIQKATVHFDWSLLPQKMKAHIEIDAPYVSILGQREWPKPSQDGWIAWSGSVKNGKLDWEGSVQFSLEHSETWSELSLKWNDADAHFYLADGKLEADLHHFHLPLLKDWIPLLNVREGRVNGRFTADTEGELLAANLSLTNVNLSLALGEINRGEGSFSYNTDVGMKWDFQGSGAAQEKEFPFQCQGRGFFKSGWLESKIQFGPSWCELSKGEGWRFECHDLSSEKIEWLQGALGMLVPEILDWEIKKGTVDAIALYNGPLWKVEFSAKELSFFNQYQTLACELAKGELNQEGGVFILSSPGYEVHFEGPWKNWGAHARIGAMDLALEGGVEEKKIPIRVKQGSVGEVEFSGEGWVDSKFNLSFHLNGMCQLFGKKISFECPHLNKIGEVWNFDLRVVRNMWDLCRLAGSYNGTEIQYHKKSHLLGEPLHFTKTPVGELDIEVQLPWQSILSTGLFLQEWGVDLKKLPKIDETKLHVQYKEALFDLVASGNSPHFSFHARESKEGWRFHLDSDLGVDALLQNDGKIKGKGRWKELLFTEFEGKIAPSFHCELSLSNLKANLELIDALKIQGRVEGQGHFIYNGEIEADLDLRPSSLVIESYPFENEDEVHLSYASSKGIAVHGINLHGPFDCKIDLLKYERENWLLNHAQWHLPGSFLNHRFLQFLDRELDLNFIADVHFHSDFSTFGFKVNEGAVPYEGAYHEIQNLAVLWEEDRCKVSLRYMGYLQRLEFQIDECVSGKLILGEEEAPLTIDWKYADRFFFHSIEGSFSGVDASFHAESENQLVGRAHVNFTELSKILPAAVAQVFSEIEMGKGYELKGRLLIENHRPSFHGLLSGKGIELFGFQFRTLLAQVDLSLSSIRIYDVKISDTAGVLVVDEIYLEGTEEAPWTLSIPNLTIRELRPSLLLRVGGSVGPIDPLVVRKLNMTDFKGFVADGTTYTANGSLHFINSYKREETLFDLPANVFSRIVGIDIDLLIPVTGDLTFNVKDGYFNLLELKNAYSEAKRSQFFLEMDPPPRMDLNGNLRIFIKMKQFVLLKITESLLISIDGILDDPQFHLTRKRFFGLM